MQSPEYVDVETVAQAYRKSPETIRRWCRAGVLDGAIHAGRDWIIPKKYAQGNIEVDLSKLQSNRHDNR